MMRIIYLLRKQIFEDKKGLITYAATVFGIMLIGSLIGGYTDSIRPPELDPAYLELFSGLLFLGGFIMTSLTFAGSMYSKVKQHSWLMIPASAGEHLASKIIYHALMYPIALILFTFLGSAISEGTSLLLFGRSALIFDPFRSDVWLMILNYIVLQSVFLLGATYFKSAHFIKTVLSLITLGIGLSLIVALFVRIIYAPYFPEVMQDSFFIDSTALMLEQHSVGLIRFVEVSSKLVYWGLLAPLCWVVSYFRIREVEANDAV